jgi:hypothetical protein
VIAAIVGVSGTVIIGVAGFGASIWNTRRTVRDAHETRVWDQRAAIYIEALAALNYRERKRAFEAPGRPLGEEREREQAYLDAYKEPDRHELDARLQAFASAPVFFAVRASVRAHDVAMLRVKPWRSINEIASAEPTADNQQLEDIAATSLLHELTIADRTDEAAVRLIRDELQKSRPAARRWATTLGPPDPLPGPSGTGTSNASR